ncbi:MAG: hypothetical protein Q9220_007584 [cf. Caloplaca sp. 1 TL-2023]
MHMIYTALATAGIVSAQGLAGNDCPFPACPPFQGALASYDNGTIGATPDSFSIIGPPLQAVHASVDRAPTGFAVDPSLNIYLTYPRNTGPTPVNVVIATNFTGEKPWPNPEIQNCNSTQNASTCFINVQNVVLDPSDPEHVMWVVDSGIPPGNKTAIPYGSKVMSFNLTNNSSLIRSYPIPSALYYDGMNANDVRINNSVGTAGFAFITDESESGSLIAIDLDTGAAVRRLFNTSVVRADPGYVGSYNGEPVYSWNGTRKMYTHTGADGIALQSGNVYWGVLASRRFYYISQTVLANFSASDQEVLDAVVFPGELGSEQAGFTADDKGVLYMMASEQNAIYQVQTQQQYITEEVNGTPPGGEGPVKPDNYVVKTLVRSALIQHADSAAIWDGYLYFCTNQLELSPTFSYGNVDKRRGPWYSYRVFVGSGPAV